MIRNIISVIDGAAGSCGKAKVCGEIATDKTINLGAAITNCMPNAGHTFVDENGNKTVFRNIPVSSVNPNTDLFIGPGSAIDMEIFKEEYERVQKYVGDRKIYVHERVPLIDERHKEYEIRNIKTGSTHKGCGAVIQEKIVRYPFLDFFKTYENAVCLSYDEWLDKLYEHIENENEYILLEGAQGCDLCLNHSGNYPYVTSRNVSTTQMLADSGISAERLLQTIMVIRPFPIRISNITNNGEYIYTGDYGNGLPLTWTQINIASMYNNYPFQGDVDEYCEELNLGYVNYLLKHCPDICRMQVFGKDYKTKNANDVNLLEALELERLLWKSHEKKEYVSQIVDLPLLKGYLPNTIIDQSEQTTVTQKERRVFDLDIHKLRNNVRINTPYGLYLNFFQHLGLEYKGLKGKYNYFEFNRYIRNYINWLEDETKLKDVAPQVLALGTGAKNGERILKKSLVKEIEKR